MISITKKITSVLDGRQKRTVCFLILLMLIGGVLESVSTSMVLPLATAVVDENNWSESWYARIICNLFHVQNQKTYVIVILVLLICLFLFKNLFLLFEQYVQFSFITKSRYEMQCRLMHSYLFKPYSFYLSAKSGEIIRVITGDTNQLFHCLIRLITFFTELVTCLFLFITMMLVNIEIAMGMIAVIALELFVILYVLRPKVKAYGDLQRSANAKSNMWLLQSIKGIKSIKVARKEAYFEGKYCEYAYKSADCERKYQVLNASVSKVIEAVTIVGALTVILILVVSDRELKSLIPQLAVFLMAAVRILPSVNRISQSYTTVRFGEGGVNNILRIIKDSGKVEKMPEHSTGDAPGSICSNDSIDFDDVTFCYPTGERDILRNASLSIHRGESVGIVGISGAGKTTLVDILLGLLDPLSGRVMADGTDIHRDLSGWLSRLSYVPQFIFISDASIKENVAFGVEENLISEKQVWEALDEAQLGDFVRGLQEGIETKVGEAGIRLSGGQIQRVGIARALYTNPEMIIFDEATSSLDNETEAALIETIKNLKGEKTLIIVAHRMSTIENCDKVFRVADGEISRVR